MLILPFITSPKSSSGKFLSFQEISSYSLDKMCSVAISKMKKKRLSHATPYFSVLNKNIIVSIVKLLEDTQIHLAYLHVLIHFPCIQNGTAAVTGNPYSVFYDAWHFIFLTLLNKTFFEILTWSKHGSLGFLYKNNLVTNKATVMVLLGHTFT